MCISSRVLLPVMVSAPCSLPSSGRSLTFIQSDGRRADSIIASGAMTTSGKSGPMSWQIPCAQGWSLMRQPGPSSTRGQGRDATAWRPLLTLTPSGRDAVAPLPPTALGRDASATRPRPRSDPSCFFGDRINLVLQEHELGLHGRDFPGELFVLGDELLEEGDDAFVMLVSFHVSECGCVRKNIRRRHACVGRRRLTPGGEGRRPIGQFL